MRFNVMLERFSFERRKVIGFAITMQHDWLKKLAPHFHPIRSKTKINRNSLARVFPRFASAKCNYYEFWLVYCNVYGFGDWLKWLLWFWFYDAQLKTALLTAVCVLFLIVIHLICHFWVLLSGCFNMMTSGNASNTKHRVWPHFQTPRGELKIRRAAEYFNLTKSEVFGNVIQTLSRVFDISSQSQIKLKRKWWIKIIKLYAN